MARHTSGWLMTLMVLRGDCQFMSRAASQDYSADQPGQVRTMGILYLLPDETAVSTVWYGVNAFQNDTKKSTIVQVSIPHNPRNVSAVDPL